MGDFKKQLFLVLFMLCAGVFASGSTSAQTWKAFVPSDPNQCSSLGQCQCPADYSVGLAGDANCTMDDFIAGCWNPSTGKCNTCGLGGTITLGAGACFNSGQGNYPGSEFINNGTSTIGPSCSTSAQCPNAGTQGGFSTN